MHTNGILAQIYRDLIDNKFKPNLSSVVDGVFPICRTFMIFEMS